MKVLMIIRATAFEVPGGDTIQATATARYLEKLGAHVEVKLTNLRINYSDFDLIHFFNIIRPADILNHVSKSKLPFVISPIYVDYSEYDQKARKGISGGIMRSMSGDAIEYWKVMARTITNREMVQSPQYLLWGQTKSICFLITNAAMLLPNSKNEIKRLFNHYNVQNTYKIIPNGIDTEIFSGVHLDKKTNKQGVLCVGQIHGLKNQLNLIKALNGTGVPLTIIGKPTLNAKAYYNKCREEAGNNVTFIDFMPQEKLIDYYRNAKVHVLPSWFETTGLSSLEAAAMGCNVVITRKGDAFEYFGERAFYCEPDGIDSIRKAVLEAHSKPVDPALYKMVIANYTWEKAAAATMDAYKTVLQ